MIQSALSPSFFTCPFLFFLSHDVSGSRGSSRLEISCQISYEGNTLYRTSTVLTVLVLLLDC